MSDAGRWTVQERDWMGQTLALAALAEGRTSPNPRVGSLLVRGGEVVGRGFHRSPGQPHAEAMAVREAGPDAHGATLFVNLEPCAHVGRTPPCSEALIRSGVRRVVASMQDPNPLVDGRGFDALRSAGIAVEVGLLGEQARLLNEPFVRWHQYRLPMVTLKAAVSADGMLAADAGVSRWITGDDARRFAHRLRLRHDAVLVGAGTVRRDDPRLTVRLDGAEEERLKVVLTRSMELDPESAIFSGSTPDRKPTVVYTSSDAPSGPVEALESVDVVRLEAAGDRALLLGVLEDLANRGVQSVLVEGGAKTLASFVDSGLAQRVALFCSPRLIGAAGGVPMLDGASAASPSEAWRIEREQLVPFGDDLLVLGRLAPPASSPGQA